LDKATYKQLLDVMMHSGHEIKLLQKFADEEAKKYGFINWRKAYYNLEVAIHG